MNIRKKNQESLLFWAEFCEDAMAAFAKQGFTQEESLRLTIALVGQVEWLCLPLTMEHKGGFH